MRKTVGIEREADVYAGKELILELVTRSWPAQGLSSGKEGHVVLIMGVVEMCGQAAACLSNRVTRTIFSLLFSLPQWK